MKRKKLIFIIPVLFTALYIFPMNYQAIHINMSNSAPKGVYIEIPGRIRKNSWVCVKTSGIKYELEIPDYIIKNVAGLPGEYYRNDENGLYIDGKNIERLKGFPYSNQEGYLDTKEYILVNDHQRSLDSRYLGKINDDNIRKVIQVIKWN